MRIIFDKYGNYIEGVFGVCMGSGYRKCLSERWGEDEGFVFIMGFFLGIFKRKEI